MRNKFPLVFLIYPRIIAEKKQERIRKVYE